MSTEFPRIYRLGAAWRTTLIAIGALFIAVSVAGVLFIILQSHGGSSLALVIVCGVGVAFVSMGLYLVACAIRTKVVLQAAGIEVHGLLSVWQLDRADISGRRLIEAGNGPKVLVLQPKTPGRKKLKLPPYLKNDAVFDEWLGGIPDLDAAEARDSEAAILANPELGMTPHERRARLALGRRVASGFRWITIAAVVWGVFYPRPYRAALVSLAVLPWIAIALVVQSRGLYRLDVKRNEANPDLSTTLLLPGFILMLRAILDVSVLDWQKAVLLALVGGVAILFLTASLVQEVREQLSRKVAFGALMCVYAYGVLVLANVELDTSKESVYDVRVAGMHVIRGKSTSYELKVEAWGPRTEPEDVSVSRSLYEAIRVGDTVCVYLMPGAFRISWFAVGTCPST